MKSSRNIRTKTIAVKQSVEIDSSRIGGMWGYIAVLSDLWFDTLYFPTESTFRFHFPLVY
jgi:hypothetical protein